jgi:ribonuclease P protein component
MRFVASPGDSFRVAYAITTSMGTAVSRNRARRRLRAVLDELDRAGELPTGACLVGLRRPLSEHTFDQLRSEVRACLAEVAT